MLLSLFAANDPAVWLAKDPEQFPVKIINAKKVSNICILLKPFLANPLVGASSIDNLLSHHNTFSF